MAEKKKEKQDWEVRQAKTFSKWCNMYLGRKGFKLKIEDVTAPEKSLGNGILVAYLLNALYDVQLPKKWKKNAKTDIQKLDNIDKALKLFAKAETKIEINRSFLLQENFKMIMGMIWQIILDYNIKGISVEDKTAKQGLLIWCRKKTKGYKGVNGKINNFTGDWSNGNAFLALVDKHTTNMVDYNDMYDKSAEEKLDAAFTACEKLGIPRLLEVEDLTKVAKPDEHSVMTYVSELFKLFSKEDVKERAAEHVSKFLKFQRRIMNLSTQYEERVKDFREWAEGKVKTFKEAEAPKTQVAAGEALTEYKAYLIDEKPPRMADVVDIQDLFANIQGELKVNGRNSYTPDDAFAPSALVDLCDELTTSENTYSKSIRDARLGFIEKMDLSTSASEEQRKEWSDSFDTFDSDNSGFLDKVEFKAALNAIGIALSEEEFDSVFNSVADEAKISRKSYTGYLEDFFSQTDDADSFVKSLETMGGSKAESEEDLKKLNCFDDDDIAFLLENMGEGENLENFIANSFRKD